MTAQKNKCKLREANKYERKNKMIEKTFSRFQLYFFSKIIEIRKAANFLTAFLKNYLKIRST